jgi:predicted transcriptional regulator
MAASDRLSLRLDPELKQWLEEEAARRDRSAGWLAKEAILALREKSESLRRIIEEAEADADRGHFVSQEAAHRWMDRLEAGFNDPPPEEDIHLYGPDA